MPHRHFMLNISNVKGTIRRLILDNPARIRIIDREAALDEADTLLWQYRRMNDKEAVHMIYDFASWLDGWPLTQEPTGRPSVY